MIKNANELKKINIERKYPDILSKIENAIDENISDGFCIITFNKNDWYTFNYSEIEWYLNLLGYKTSYDSDRYSGDSAVEISWEI